MEAFDVVWNGVIDRAWAIGQHQEPPPEGLCSAQPVLRPDAFIAGSVGDRILRFLAASGDEPRTVDAIADALHIGRTAIYTNLRRAWTRGCVVRAEHHVGQPARYRLNQTWQRIASGSTPDTHEEERER